MAKKITGIRALRTRIEDIVKRIENIGDKQATIPRNKIVLVDYAWDLTNPVMSETKFLSPQCKELAEHRTVSRPNPTTGNEDNPYLVPKAYYGTDHITKEHPRCGYTNASLHGTACAAVLNINEQFVKCFDVRESREETSEKDKESDLWNICPETEVILAPVREFAGFDTSRFEKTFEAFMARANQKPADKIIGLLATKLFDNIGPFWGKVVEEAIREGARDRSELVKYAQDFVREHLSKADFAVEGKVVQERDDTTLVTSLVQILTELSLPLFDEFGIAQTLAAITDAVDKGELCRGDVVVMPIEFRANFDAIVDTSDPTTGRAASKFFDKIPASITKLPVIIFPEVEAAIERLTSRGISVVISAGNVRANLSQLDLSKLFAGAMCGTIHVDRENIFKTFGVSCGAILVGATNLKHKQNWLDPIHNDPSKGGSQFSAENSERMRNSHGNHGICVDAFGRGAANTVAGYRYELDTKVSKDLYAHWCGASIAAVVTAASLATLQQYRMAVADLQKATGGDDLKPLKPIEARSHFRVFRSQRCSEFPCRTELMGPPPDVIAILEGANLKHP